jgi:hypothetical protein
MNRNREVHSVAMNPTWKRRLLWLAAIPVVSAVLAFAAPFFYWGYFVEPSLGPLLHGIERVDKFTALWPRAPITLGGLGVLAAVEMDVAGNEAYAFGGREALACFRPRPDADLGEPPTSAFAVDLERRGLTIASEDVIDPALLSQAVRDLLPTKKKHRLELDVLTSMLHGLALQAIQGRDRHGREILVASTAWTLWNDHYRYRARRYVIASDGTLIPERTVSFRFDSAGLEGVVHWLAGFGSAFVLFAVWVCFALIFPFLCFVADLFASTAAPASPNDAP